MKERASSHPSPSSLRW